MLDAPRTCDVDDLKLQELRRVVQTVPEPQIQTNFTQFFKNCRT
jgi:hypothetical protein